VVEKAGFFTPNPGLKRVFPFLTATYNFFKKPVHPGLLDPDNVQNGLGSATHIASTGQNFPVRPVKIFG
jgi:hypothetical protein